MLLEHLSVLIDLLYYDVLFVFGLQGRAIPADEGECSVVS